MNRGSACAVWILLLCCSPSGEGGEETVVNQPAGNGQAPAAPVASGGSSSTPVTAAPPGSGDIFGGDVGCTNGCAFGTDPLLDVNVAAADIGVFDDAVTFAPGGVCVLEPQLSNGSTPGALFPRNWLRPRFRWASSGGETLWEVRLQNDDQPDPLRAYTRDTQWILPAEIWAKMKELQKPTTVTIRGVGPTGAITGSQGTFSIAPVDAGGSMVFWATSSSLVTQDSSRLMGFSVGDEGVVPTLSAVQVNNGLANIPGEDGAVARGFYACGGATPRPTCTANDPNPACCVPTNIPFGKVECVGCHVSTPDGKAVIFTDNWPWNKVAASIEPGLTGTLPATVTQYASDMMKQPWLGMQAVSPAFFSTDPGGERMLVTSYGMRPSPGTKPFEATQPTQHSLAWFNLAAQDPTPLTVFPETFGLNPYGDGSQNLRNTEVGAGFGTAWGLIATSGEARNAVTPSWSADGTQIAYVSTDIASTDGHPDWKANVADVKVVPYNNRAGGAATPLAGASDPAFLEYYPQFSADDAFVAFARAPVPSVPTRCMPSQDANGVVTSCPQQDLGANPDGPYYNRNGEIYIVPRAGATVPTRLVANDPVSCSGETARGSINSWPRWSPRTETADGSTYYFLIFSSARGYLSSSDPKGKPFLLDKARLTPAISNKSSQLYMAPIVVDASGAVTTYPAIYLWNQDFVVDTTGNATVQATSNLTPAWNDFSIPPVPPVLQVPR